jgi:hypothetical protein
MEETPAVTLLSLVRWSDGWRFVGVWYDLFDGKLVSKLISLMVCLLVNLRVFSYSVYYQTD